MLRRFFVGAWPPYFSRCLLPTRTQVAKAKPLLPEDGATKLEALGQAWIDPLVKAGDLALMAHVARLDAGVSLGTNDGSPMGATIDASYGPMRGSVTCYMDDAGHVVSLGKREGDREEEEGAGGGAAWSALPTSLLSPRVSCWVRLLGNGRQSSPRAHG